MAPKARMRPHLTEWCVREGGLIRIKRGKDQRADDGGKPDQGEEEIEVVTARLTSADVIRR